MNNIIRKQFRLVRKNSERGFTLLEYCAGAAVLLTIVWAALTALGTNMSTFLNAVGSWATTQAVKVNSNSDAIK